MSTSTGVRAGAGMRALALTAVILTIVLIATGSSVRVTGSGMGCLDEWPLCHGRILPPLEFTAILEWVHRLTTSVVSLPILVLAFLAARRHRTDRAIVIPAFLAVFFLLAQIVLGAIVVRLALPPALVGIHLANSMLVLGALAALAVALFMQRSGNRHRARGSSPAEPLRQPGYGRGLTRLTYATALATYAQIVLGSVVVHISASAACAGFPLCSGELLPAGTLAQVHMAHRALGALAALGAIAMAGTALRARPGSAARRLLPALAGVAALFVIQIALGAGNVLLGFPRPVNVLHLACAAILWASLAGLAVHMALSERAFTDNVLASHGQRHTREGASA